MNTHRQIMLSSTLLVLALVAVVWAQQSARAPMTAEQETQACQQCHGKPDLYGFDVQGRARVFLWI